MPRRDWDTDGVARRAGGELARRMRRGMLLLEGETKRLLATGQPVVRSGGTLRGLDPSVAPDPPHKVSGRLAQSITSGVEVDLNSVTGRVGTNVVYARRQELGFQGVDARGRNVNQAPRPFLRRALRENLRRIFRILGAG